MKLTHTINGAALLGIFAAAIMTFGIFASTAQADPVLQGYWTFDSDTVDSGIIVESSGYQAAGTHDGLIKGTGVSYQSISGEAGPVTTFMAAPLRFPPGLRGCLTATGNRTFPNTARTATDTSFDARVQTHTRRLRIVDQTAMTTQPPILPELIRI